MSYEKFRDKEYFKCRKCKRLSLFKHPSIKPYKWPKKEKKENQGDRYMSFELDMITIRESSKNMTDDEKRDLYKRYKTNPVIGVILNLFIPGVGQIYNGELRKAIAIFAGMFISVILIIVFIGLLLLPAIWVYSLYDAYKSAEYKNEIIYSIIYKKAQL